MLSALTTIIFWYLLIGMLIGIIICHTFSRDSERLWQNTNRVTPRKEDQKAFVVLGVLFTAATWPWFLLYIIKSSCKPRQ